MWNKFGVHEFSGMRFTTPLAIVTSLLIAVTAAQSQPTHQKVETLSLEQKTKISQLITRQTAPLASSGFFLAVDGIVPSEVEIHSLPPAAEQVAPQIRGYGYVVVEEQIALVDPSDRKIATVFPRWREQ